METVEIHDEVGNQRKMFEPDTQTAHRIKRKTIFSYKLFVKLTNVIISKIEKSDTQL